MLIYRCFSICNLLSKISKGVCCKMVTLTESVITFQYRWCPEQEQEPAKWTDSNSPPKRYYYFIKLSRSPWQSYYKASKILCKWFPLFEWKKETKFTTGKRNSSRPFQKVITLLLLLITLNNWSQHLIGTILSFWSAAKLTTTVSLRRHCLLVVKSFYLIRAALSLGRITSWTFFLGVCLKTKICWLSVASVFTGNLTQEIQVTRARNFQKWLRKRGSKHFSSYICAKDKEAFFPCSIRFMVPDMRKM